jgi:hypothetical protein
VRGERVTEARDLLPVGGEHAAEAATALVDVGHGRPRCQLRIRDVPKAPVAAEGDEFLLRSDAGDCVVGLPSIARYAIATAPSTLTVRIHTGRF